MKKHLSSSGPSTSSNEKPKHTDENDFEPSDQVQKRISKGNPNFNQCLENYMEKEESHQGDLENKINKYSLRQYINLEKSFNVNCRPNYYEPDLEDKETTKGKKKRSHLIPHDQQEADPVLYKKLRNKKSSEELTTFEKRGGNIETEEVPNDLVNDDTVCVTRTVTYASKKQILKFFQKEYINVSQITNIEFDKDPEIKRTESENQDPSGIKVNLKSEAKREGKSYIQKEMETFYKNLQNQKPGERSKNIKFNFLEQLGLKSQQQNKHEGATPLLQTDDSTNKLKALKNQKSSKSAGIKKKFDGPSCSGYQAQTTSITKNKKSDTLTKTKSYGKLKKVTPTENKTNDQPEKNSQKCQHTVKNNSVKGNSKQPNLPVKNNEQQNGTVNISHKKTPSYYEIIQRACDNLHNSGSAKQQKSAKPLNVTKVCKFKETSATQKTNKQDVENGQTSSNLENKMDSEAGKSLTTFREENRTSCSEKSKADISTNENRKQYNICDVEKELKNMFRGLVDEKLIKKSKRDEKYVKPTKENKPGSCTKERPKGELDKSKQSDKNTQKKEKCHSSKPQQHKYKDSKRSNEKTVKDVKILKDKKYTNCKLKTSAEQRKQTYPEKCRNVENENKQNSVAENLQINSTRQDKLKKTENTVHCRETGIKKKSNAENLQTNSNKRRAGPNKLKKSDNNVCCTENSSVIESVTVTSNRTEQNNSNAADLKQNNDEDTNSAIIVNIQTQLKGTEQGATNASTNIQEDYNEAHTERNSETAQNSNINKFEPNKKYDHDAHPLLEEERNLPEELQEKVQITSLCKDITGEINSKNPEIVSKCCCCSSTKPALDELSNKDPFQNGSSKDGTKEDEVQKNRDTSLEKKTDLHPDVIVILDDEEEKIATNTPRTEENRDNLAVNKDINLDNLFSVLETINPPRTNQMMLHEKEVCFVHDNIIFYKLSNVVLTTRYVSKTIEDQLKKRGLICSNTGNNYTVQVLNGTTFPYEWKSILDICQFVAMLTDFIATQPLNLSEPKNLKRKWKESSTVSTRIENNPNCNRRKVSTEYVKPDMTKMEHYKKRLIHQHEKPGVLPSPYTTTEEEDDSLQECPSSPASSGQSRDSGCRDKKRDETGPKVARKRAVCRSQFRHQNMELFKLGTSIPTSLCKTKEPYSICAEKNLQMCFQNCGSRKNDKPPPSSKDTLTESIINTMEGGKKKEVPLWRSVSLNSDLNNSSNSGRHILPAIVPELSERRKNRVKSLPESNGCEKNTILNKVPTKSVYEFIENNETKIAKQPITQNAGEEQRESKNNNQNAKSVSSESDVPMNLSLKKRDKSSDQRTSLSLKGAKTNEVNNNQYLSHSLSKQPSNVPKRSRDTGNVENVDGLQREDEKCLILAAIPTKVLDSQKQNNVIVINFPQMQKQMLRMDNKTLSTAQQSPLEMLDSAIMSLVNIVKSSVESVFNIMSLPVLNRLYTDLNRYLVLPAVSANMKVCIEEALNSLISYLLVNLFCAPSTPKSREFVHRLLQMDLRPHMDFLVTSLNIIRQKIKSESFMEHLLNVFSQMPQKDHHVSRMVVGDAAYRFPPPKPLFPNRNEQFPMPELMPNLYFGENVAYQGQNCNGRTNPIDMLNGAAPHIQQHKRGCPQEQQMDLNVSMRLENLGNCNLAPMRPDLYLTDNRCIPPNMSHIYPEPLFLHPPPSQPRVPKGRPKNSSRINKIPPKCVEGSTTLFLPELPGERAIYREKQFPNPHDRSINKNLRQRPLIDGMRKDNANVVSTTTITQKNMAGGKILPSSNGLELVEQRHVLNRDRIFLSNKRNAENLCKIGGFEKFLYEDRGNKDANGENIWNMNIGNYFVNQTNYVPVTPNDINDITTRIDNVGHRKSFDKSETNKSAVIISNEILKPRNITKHFKMANISNTTAQLIPRNCENLTSNVSETVVKQCAVSDVEQFLQTNIIINKNQTYTSNLEDVSQKPVDDKTSDGSGSETSINEQNANTGNICGSSTLNTLPNCETVMHMVPESFQNGPVCSESKIDQVPAQSNENGEIEQVVSRTVIIEDNSMEISKGGASNSAQEEVTSLKNRATDMDDVVVEKVCPSMDVRNGISFSSSDTNHTPEETNKDGVENGSNQGRTSIQIKDVSIEKVTDKTDDGPPQLIRLASLKRKLIYRRLRRKRVRWAEPQKGNIVIIDDDEKDSLDCNPIETNKSNKIFLKNVKSPIRAPTNHKPHRDAAFGHELGEAKSPIPKPITPMIEDISSEEEGLEPFRMYSTYDGKIGGDPKKILMNTEVSHCPLIVGNVDTIMKTNPHLFEKLPVYTRPVVPQNRANLLEEDENIGPTREPLANLVHFEKEEGTFKCSLKVKNNSELRYPSSLDPRSSSPVNPSYRISVGNASPPPVSLTPPGVVPRSPVGQISPSMARSSVVQMSPVIRSSAIIPISSADPMYAPRSATAYMSPLMSSIDESNLNWRRCVSEEQKRTIFNLERSQSLESGIESRPHSPERQNNMDSEHTAKFGPDESYCEVKFDSKVYKIKKSVYEKIPKGKLCYIRETNTFVRYFDDNQMELFLSNLNVEGNGVANDIVKQVKGRGIGSNNVDTFIGPQDTSGKGEVIVLSKDVVFSAEDFLPDPELYVEEVEKVQRYVPKDFYGFYKFVTGYQIINHHHPISFQTFLTMHNTNGIRLLFNNYVEHLVQGKKPL